MICDNYPHKFGRAISRPHSVLDRLRTQGFAGSIIDDARAICRFFNHFFSTLEGRDSPFDPEEIAAHVRFVHSSFLINLADYRLQEHPLS